MSAPSPRRRRLLIALPLAALGLALIAALGAKWAVGRYIEGDAFRQLAGRNTGGSLHATAEYAPFHLEGSDLSTEGLQAQGRDDAAFARLEIGSIRARWSMRKLLDRVCQLDAVEVEQATLALDGPRRPADPTVAKGSPPEPPGLLSGWLPNRLEVGSATLRHGRLSWLGGKLHDFALQAASANASGHPDEWKIEGQGGSLQNDGWPALEVQSVRLRYRAPTLFVESASLHQGRNGTVDVDGEVRFGEDLDLHLKAARLPVDLVLTPDWRQHVRGTLSGEATVRTPLPIAGLPTLSGSWSLAEAQLEALPILDELATFTNTAQFRRLPLTRAGGDFRQTGSRLELTHIVAESAGLARLEGSCTFQGDTVDATLQIGVIPALLQWLPGARGRVFAASREGYLWTTVRLSGPLTHPSEDLTPRLVAAAAGEVIDTGLQAPVQVRQKAEEAAKGVLDLFFGK